ncbi:MAG: L,D-transpeptidase [Sphingobacteriia bacterium]|nr:L,D-transpeptidase [Sphingobacteriia bacterium]NCC38637.1 L,D-transpeptidase [Gammaproteobacteria bacterium]
MITTARWGLILLIAAVGLGGCVGASQRPAPEMKPAPVSDRGLSAERSARASGRAATRKPRELTIQLESQSFLYREHGEVVHSGPISSGRAGYPTPLGHFAVLSKQADKVSYRYTNQLGMPAWMPYSIQFHGHYFLHEGWLPGYPDSHGCVRVGERDARFLFERLQIGDRIAVVD